MKIKAEERINLPQIFGCRELATFKKLLILKYAKETKHSDCTQKDLVTLKKLQIYTPQRLT